LIDYDGSEVNERQKWTPLNQINEYEYYNDSLCFNYDIDESPYINVRDLFLQLKNVGPLLVKLDVASIGSYGYDADSSAPVTSIRWVRNDTSSWVIDLGHPHQDSTIKYWEVSTFIDTSAVDSTDYFMLVNRVTSISNGDEDITGWDEAPDRAVEVYFTRPSGTNPFIEEIFFNKKRLLFSDSTVGGLNYFTYTDTLEAGDGRIYRVTDVLSGTITENMTLNHDYMVVGDLTISSGDTLTLEQGVTLYVLPDSGIDITVNGALIANGNPGDSVRIISWDEYTGDTNAVNWNGIDFGTNSFGDFDYCAIRDVEDIAIDIEDSSQVSLNHCLIKDVGLNGIDSYKGFIYVNHSTFQYIGLKGIYAYKAESVIDSCYFDVCGRYGIYIYLRQAGCDSTIITNCTVDRSITQVPDSSQYCIYVGGFNDVRIENNFLRYYKQGGIKLSSSDAKVIDNDIVNCTNYGIYAHNSDADIKDCIIDTVNTGIYCNGSEPKVRHCLFDNLSIGVRDNGFCPDLGKWTTVRDPGNSDFTGCSNYYIWHGQSLQSPLWAELNYFGGTPSLRKFYGPSIDYTPWSLFPPSFKLTDEPDIPFIYQLNHNYPNPFNPTTTISFSLAEPGYTSISIYNILGQKVSSLVDEYKSPGIYSVIWDGRNKSGAAVSSGVYFYRVESGEFNDTKKMLLLR